MMRLRKLNSQQEIMSNTQLTDGGNHSEVISAQPRQPKPRAVAAPLRKTATQRASSQATEPNVAKPSHVVPLMSPVSQRRTPEDADVAWAAGVMDGEGCVHIARQTWGETGRRPTYRMRVQIAQNDLVLLREFEWCVGIAGRLYSPKPTRKQNRTCHNLVYDGVRAFDVLERMGKYLRRKKAQAELAAEYRETCAIHLHSGPNGWPESMWELRHWYYLRMSDLKRA